MKAINFIQFRKHWHWFLLPLLYSLARLLLLFYSPHYIYRFEELYQGYLGIEFLDGNLRGSIWDYQIDPYTGGSLIVGALAALSFKIFGTSLFALKLVPFAFSFLTLLTAMGFLERFFGHKAAVAGGLLLSFPAPALASLSISALGSHPESRLFAMGIIWVLYEIIFKPKTSKRIWFLLGLLSGLALVFSMLNIVVIISGFFTALQLRKKIKFSPASILSGAAGAILGFSPAAIYNVRQDFDTVHYFSNFLRQNGWPSLIDFFVSWSLEGARLVLGEIPGSLSLFLQKTVWDHLFSSSYCLITLFFIFFLIQKILPESFRDFGEVDKDQELKSKLIYFGLFPIIFLPVISFISLTMAWHGEMLPYRFRYFAIFYLYLCLLGAILGTRRERICKIFLAAMIFMGAVGYAALLKPQNAGRLMRVPGYSIEPTIQVLTSHSLPHSSWINKNWKELLADENLFLKAVHDPSFWDNIDISSHKKRIHRLNPRLKYYFILNWAGSAAATSSPGKFEIPSWLDESEKDVFYFGFARGLDWAELLESPSDLKTYYQSMPSRGKIWFLFVFGRHGFVWNPYNYQYELTVEELAGFEKEIEPNIEKWVFRGVGAAFLRHFPNLHPLQKDSEGILKVIPKVYHDDFWWGLGWNMRGRKGQLDNNWLEIQILQLPEDVKREIRKGFEDYQKQWYEAQPVVL